MNFLALWFPVACATSLLAQDPPAGQKPVAPVAPAAAAPAPNQAQELLHKALRFTQSLPALRAKVKATMVMPELPDGMEIEIGELPEVDVELCVALPNRFRLVADEPFGGSAICDGKQLLRSHQGMELHSVSTAPKSAQEWFTRKGQLMELPGQSTLAQLLAPTGSKRALLDCKQVEQLADEKVGKRDCHHLVIKDDGMACELWIAKGDEPYVLRHKPVPAKLDMQALMNGGGEEEPAEGEDGATMSISLMPGFDVEFLEVDKEPSQDAFAIIEPKGSEKVDDLDQAMREKMEEQMGEMAFDNDTGDEVPAEGEGAGKVHATVGKPAPEVELKLVTGESLKLADCKGKVVVLDFWATWCGPCVQGLPKVAEVTSKLADQGVVFVACNLAESKPKVEAFLEKKGLQIQVALVDQAVGEKFGVSGIPHTVVIGRDGVISAVHVGFGPGGEKQLEKDIQVALGGEKKVEPPKPTEGKKEAPKQDAGK